MKTISPSHLLATLVLGTSLLAVGCSGEGSSQKLYQDAVALRAKGDNKGAIIQLKNAVQKHPDNRDARFLLGQIYVDDGQPAAAEKELRKALELGYAKHAVLPELGRVLMSQGEFDKLLSEIQPAADMKPADKAAVLALRGNALIAKGKVVEAKAILLDAKQVDPENTSAYLGLASVALDDHNVAEALALVDTAIAKNPKKANAWLVKGTILGREGRLPEAVQAFESAVKAEPDSVQAKSALASIYLDQGKNAEARSQLEQAKKLNANDLQTLYLLAAVDFREKKLPQARDQLQQILRIAPTHVPSLVLSGAVSLALGTYEQAEKNLLYVVQNQPRHDYARRLLGMTYLQMKEPKKAVDILVPVAKDTKDGPTLALLGEAYMKLGEHAKASEYLDRAAELAPKNAQVRTSLGVSRLARGDVEGVSDLEAASGLDQTQFGADVMLVMAHVFKKEWDQALAAIATLEKKQPDNPVTHHLKGGVYLNKQDFASARKAYEKAVALKPDFFPALINLARMDIRDNKPDAARKRFEQVLAKDAKHIPSMLALADIEQTQGREKEMVGWLEKAAKADPAAYPPRALLAQYYQRKGDMARALAVAREAQAANSKSPEALDLLGSLQLATGDKDGALASFSQLTVLAPKSAAAFLKLAQAQAASGNNNAARNSVAKSLELQPDFVDAKAAMFGLAMQEKRYPAALDIARGLQKQTPKSGLGWVLEGDVAAAQEQFTKAADAYRTAQQIEPTTSTLLKLHIMQSRLGQAKEADNQLVQWLKTHPNDHLGRGYLADSYTRQGHAKAAIAEYETLLKSLPDNVVALNNLAWLYYQQKDGRAVTTAERAYKLKPDAPQIMDTLGWILVQQGDQKRGLGLIQQAFSKQPDQPTIHYHLAAAFAKSGDRAKAQQELERLMKRGLKFPEEQEAQALLKQIQGAR